MEEKEYEYKRLNIKNGDIINDYHINYLQDAISKISSESKDFKNNLANILKEKGLEASNEDTFKDLLSKVKSLQSSPERTHDEQWPDISKTIESGHIRLLVQTGIEISFWIKPSKPATFVINWGNGSIDRVYILNVGQTVKKTLNNIGLTTIDISLDTEDCRIEEFKTDTGTSRNSILWFCSKDIFFTTGYGMFNGNSVAAPCENLKYIDFIGGGVNGELSYFAKGCIKLERVTGNLNPNGYNAKNAFENCQNLKDLPILNLNGVKSVDYLFFNCASITDFPYYINNDGSITSALSMFRSCTNLTKFVANQEFNFSNADKQNQCFYNCTSLTTSPKIKFGRGNASQFFYSCITLRTLTQDTFDLPEVTDASSFFQNCSNLIDGPSKFLAPKATNVSYLFANCSTIQQVPTSLIFPIAANAENLFTNCYSLRIAPTTIDLPLATNIKEMFKTCNALLTPPTLIKAETAKEAYDLFHSCNSLRETPNTITLLVATNIQGMFYNCTSITIGPDLLQAPMAVNAASCFYNCKSLINAGKNIEIGNKNPGECSFSSFFQNCTSLKTLPTEGDMHKGKMYNNFFDNSGNIDYGSLNNFCNKGLEFPEAVNLTGFFISNTNIRQIPSITANKCNTATQLFQNTQNLESIRDINLPNCNNMQYMFYLTGQSLLDIGKINLTTVNTNNGNFTNLTKIQQLTLVGLRMDFVLNNATNLTSVKLENPDGRFIGSLQFNSCKLNVDALNSLLDSLPNVTSRTNKPSIQIKSNPGSSECNPATAKANGWNVITN